MLDQQEAQARLEWAVGKMPGMEGVGFKVVGELPEVRAFWTQFTRGERMVTAKVPRSMIEMVDIERGILPLAMSDYLRGIMLMFGTGGRPDAGVNGLQGGVVRGSGRANDL